MDVSHVNNSLPKDTHIKSWDLWIFPYLEKDLYRCDYVKKSETQRKCSGVPKSNFKYPHMREAEGNLRQTEEKGDVKTEVEIEVMQPLGIRRWKRQETDFP